MEHKLIYGGSFETVDHYEIHNGKGKALTHANTWQNPNKKTKSFSTLKEAIDFFRCNLMPLVCKVTTTNRIDWLQP